MQRRNFLIASSLFASSRLLNANDRVFIKDFDNVRLLFESLSFHFFPENSSIGFGKDMKIVDYLFDTMSHKSFDRDVKNYVINGAKEFEKTTKGKFIKMTKVEKERVLREFEKTTYGKSWLSRILRLMLEGVFCDPIYGSNTKEMAWKSINTFGAYPRPKNRYMGL